MPEYKHNCREEHAPKFLDWIKNRGGVAVWKSIDLSDPGYSMSSPAKTMEGEPYSKPHWKVGDAPSLVVTDPCEIEVHCDREVKRFHAALRRGAQGLKIKLTDHCSDKVHKEVMRAGEGAYYEFDYDTQEVVIMGPAGNSLSLTEWEKTQNATVQVG